MIKYTDKTSPLQPQLIKLRESYKLKTKSALIFRFVEVKKEKDLLINKIFVK
jgi:hypothetical protein